MRKNSNTSGSSKRVEKSRKTDRITIGMDLGDKKSRICMLDEAGEVIREALVATTKKGMSQIRRSEPWRTAGSDAVTAGPPEPAAHVTPGLAVKLPLLRLVAERGAG